MPTAAVARGATEPGSALLRAALDRCGWWDVVAATTKAGGQPCPVALVPTLSGAAAVRPGMVEDLVDVLHERGRVDVVVGVALTDVERRLGHCDAVAYARSAGYRDQTAAGAPYRVVDLLAAVQPAQAPPAAVIAGRDVATVWVKAALRIIAARCVTDAADGLALTVHALPLVVAPIRGAAHADVAAEVLAYLPPQLAVIDARVSSHGPDGARNERPVHTATVIAATDALLADVCAVLLTGVDPAVSRPVAAALRHPGLPRPHQLVGDLTPFPGWQPAPPWLRGAVRRSEPSPRLAAVLDAATRDGAPAGNAAVTDPGPDRAGPAVGDDRMLRVLRQALAPLTGGSADPQVAATALAALHTGFAVATEAARAWATVLAKDRLERRELPLGFDPADYDASDYDAVIELLQPLEELLAVSTPRSGGLRLRPWESSTLFEVERVLNAPYEALVERVPLAGAIEMMADYLGGRRVVLATDAQGRVVRQAERNLYLAQPNYLALSGGEPIDVCKIDVLRYGDRWQRICWRTVRSPNGSARYDDGSVLMEAAGPGRSRVVFRGRQEFTLPPLWQAADLELLPAVKDALVEDAYRRFFSATLDNIEAMYEGREFRIGRPAVDRSEPPITRAAEPLWEAVGRLLSTGAPQGGRTAARRRGRQMAEVDEHGFTHLRGRRRPGRRWELP